MANHHKIIGILVSPDGYPDRRWVPREVLGALAQEAMLVASYADFLRSGEPPLPEDIERLYRATRRIRAAAIEGGRRQ